MEKLSNNSLEFNYIYDYINNMDNGAIDLNDVRLFFIERIKDKDESIRYIVYRTESNPKNKTIEKEIVKIIKKSIHNIHSKEPQTIPYEPSLTYDKNCIESLAYNEIPNFEDIYHKTFENPEIVSLGYVEDIDNIWGYLIRIPISNDEIKGHLFFVKKYSIQKLLGKSKFIVGIDSSSGRCDVINDALTLDRTFDGVIIICKSKSNDITNGLAYIFNKSSFELLFSFNESYKKEVISRKNELIDIFDSEEMELLIDKTKGDLKKIKKLADVIRCGYYTQLTPEKIDNIKNEFNLKDLELDENGKIIVSSSNVWTVLKVLHDDYLKSSLTNNKYEVHSKKKS